MHNNCGGRTQNVLPDPVVYVVIQTIVVKLNQF